MKTSTILSSALLFILLVTNTYAQTADEKAALLAGPKTANKTSSITTTTIPEKAAGNCDTLTTFFNQNNGLAGIMFDLIAVNDVMITQFYANINVGTGPYEIYYKNGSYNGSQTNAAAWTLAGSGSVTSTALNTPTLIPIPVNVAIAQGATMAFYITATTSSVNIKYKDGTSLGAVLASNPDLIIEEGLGVGYSFGFNIGPRQFNGIVEYCHTTIGMDEIENINAEVFYNSQSIVFNIDKFYEIKQVDYALSDMSGRVILKGSNKNSSFNIDVPELNGIYNFTYTVNQKNLQCKKLAIFSDALLK